MIFERTQKYSVKDNSLLRNMLISHPSQIRMAIHILPSEVLRKILGSQIVMRKRVDDVLHRWRVGIWIVLCINISNCYQDSYEMDRDSFEGHDFDYVCLGKEDM